METNKIYNENCLDTMAKMPETNMHNRKLKADTSEQQAGILYPLLSVCNFFKL